LLDDVRANKIPSGSCLIVENLDRLSRQDINESMDILRTFMRAGIDVHTISDNRIYAAKEFGFVDHILSGVQSYLSNLESTKKQERVRQAWANKRANAKTTIVTAAAPKWLRLSRDRSRFEVIKDKTTIVRSIFDDSACGIGIHTINKRLNEARIPPFGAPWKKKQGTRGWQTCSVRALLNNRAVLGEWQPCRMVNGKRVPDGDPISNYFPSIIDESIFNRAQQGMKQRLINGKPKGGGRKGSNISNLFSGIARCAYCGSSMQFENKSSRGAGTYLSCSNARRGLGCKVTSGWAYDDFEASFLAFVSELDLVSILNSNASARLEVEREIAALHGKFISLDEIQARYLKLFETTELATNVVAKKLDEVAQHRVATNALIEAKEHDLKSMASNVISKDELHEAIARLQNGDDIYKLRAEVAQKLRTIISSLYVATVGTDPLIKMAKDAIDDPDDCDAVIQFFGEAPSTGRFFEIQFRDGSFRAVQPSEDNPLDYHQQHSDADREIGSLPMNIGAFHQLLNEAQGHS
jgi:DNA invertase Pin-like site-specific DNA recombinase